jgi:hypothetical protein
MMCQHFVVCVEPRITSDSGQGDQHKLLAADAEHESTRTHELHCMMPSIAGLHACLPLCHTSFEVGLHDDSPS